MIVLVVVAWMLAARLALVVVPMILALFPAALLAPAVGWLDRLRVPRPLAVLAVLLTAAAVVAGAGFLVVPAVAAELPTLARSLTDAGNRLDALIDQLPSVPPDTTPGELIRQGVVAVVGGVGSAVRTGLSLLSGLVLAVVLLALYLAGGARIVATGTSALPAARRPAARELLDQVWQTLSTYTRTLFVVALLDATLIGLGLWALDVPVVLPLSVLVFFGAFVPFVGAFVSGLVAVLVAFADAGVVSALLVLGLIVVVQQIEGNVVQPLLMGRAIRLSAFTVIVAIGIGAALLGVLGAFLAVPVAAVTARTITFARSRSG
ncbi:AI-2E family transporter [Pseudonocardia nigra]|uniref:AI-2E family transporter n=1 Tax=Pseudonocardia nigra TaxID=1921578 RepID=UPI001C605FC3|nr:AI-2E family transporter [Pseudonocardia nigra]